MNTDYTPDYPDPLHPEDMQDPVPVGICLTDCKDLTDTYYFRGDGIVKMCIRDRGLPESKTVRAVRHQR